MPIVYVLIATFLCTLLGGFVALRYKGYSHIFSGLTAGVLISVIFLEIIPEILEIRTGSLLPLIWVVIGFAIFHVFEKMFALHHSHGELEHEHSHTHPATKLAGVWALIGHSFIDGLGIGLAYQVSPAFGLVLAIGVIAHDFSDGFNTVALTSHRSDVSSRRFLFADAIAPAIGAIVGLWIALPDAALGIILSIFAGILLYVATGDILPEAHCSKKRHTFQHLVAMLVGIAYIGCLIAFLG